MLGRVFRDIEFKSRGQKKIENAVLYLILILLPVRAPVLFKKYFSILDLKQD